MGVNAQADARWNEKRAQVLLAESQRLHGIRLHVVLQMTTGSQKACRRSAPTTPAY
jgi:hypothetical protein